MLNIIDLNAENKNMFVEMCIEFYTSDAVMHSIPKSHIEKTADFVVSGSPFARCLILELDNVCAGYALLSFTYSNEAGGMVLLLEEIYIKDIFRGKGIAKEFFNWLYENYDSDIKRYRLEVSRDNDRVCRLYSSLNFSDFDYLQMVRDL